MGKLTDDQLFENIHTSFCRIHFYSKNLSEEELLNDIKTQDAIAYCLLIIGKCCNQLSDSFKKKQNILKPEEWPFLALFMMDYFYQQEEIWNVLHDEDFGIITNYLRKVQLLYKEEKTNKNRIRKTDSSKDENLPFCTEYKYAIHSKNSLWTVKKR